MTDSVLRTHHALSSRAKRAICFFLLMSASASVSAQTPQRPRITAIDHVRVYAADIDKSREFYSKLIGVRPKGGACLDASPDCLTVGWGRSQTIELEKVPASGTKNWLAEVAFATDDVKGMRAYLIAHGVTVSKITEHKYAERALYADFEARDPEGIPISFIHRFEYPVDDPGPGAPSYVRILHAGFVVKDLAAENRFYGDLLGFRLYWRGGFKDDGLDWYEIQVPDGNNWVEFMLNIPANADQKELGVQNHFSLGVENIHLAADALRKNGISSFDGPEIGRDGKWALDAYDPDGTRIELMEFTPAQKPCCNDYTAPHPRP